MADRRFHNVCKNLPPTLIQPPLSHMPRLSLQSKAFLALTLLLAVMMTLFIGFSRLGLQRGLGPYVAEIELARMDWLAYRLQTVYEQGESWQTLKEQPAMWRAVRRPPGGWLRPDEFDPRPGSSILFPRNVAPNASHPDDEPRAPRSPRTPAAEPFATSSPTAPSAPPASISHPADALANRLAVLDEDKQLVVGNLPSPGHASTPLKDDAGRVIGYLVMNPPEGLEREADRAFLEKQLGFVLWTGATGLVLALLLSGWLAHRWLRPIGALVQGAKALAAGHLQTRIPEQADSQEFSRLVHTFLDMATQLDSMETSRRQWIGDMAHELRTPLAAMRAEIEALQDGIRRFDDQTAARLHRQLMRMIQLVGDLRTSIDSSSAIPTLLEPMHPMTQLNDAIAAMQSRFEQAGVGIALHEPPEWLQPALMPRIDGNPQQLHRVFLNLLENSLRYTERGGHLRILAATMRDRDNGRQFVLTFDDTEPGVAPHELQLIFERLYRTESSRKRTLGDLGGSGLGLAICRAIVQAHGGLISADHSPLGGLRVVVSLPMLEKALDASIDKSTDRSTDRSPEKSQENHPI